MFLKLLFVVSFSDLLITIQYAVFRKSLTTFHLSLYLYIYNNTIYIRYVHIYIYRNNSHEVVCIPIAATKVYN